MLSFRNLYLFGNTGADPAPLTEGCRINFFFFFFLNFAENFVRVGGRDPQL